MTNDKISIKCPFVYANGHQCQGLVYRARAYGPAKGPIGAVRLFCSEQGDHNGNHRNEKTMEWYVDELPPHIKDDVLALFAGGEADVELTIRGATSAAPQRVLA